jgi:hypothetical protein
MSDIFCDKSYKFFIEAIEFAGDSQWLVKDDIGMLEISAYLFNIFNDQLKPSPSTHNLYIENEADLLAHLRPFYHSFRCIVAQYIQEFWKTIGQDMLNTIVRIIKRLDLKLGRFPHITQRPVWE